MKFFQHLKTITHHKWLVLRGCFQVGLYRQDQKVAHRIAVFLITVGLIGKRKENVPRPQGDLSVFVQHPAGTLQHHADFHRIVDMQRKVLRIALFCEPIFGFFLIE